MVRFYYKPTYAIGARALVPTGKEASLQCILSGTDALKLAEAEKEAWLWIWQNDLKNHPLWMKATSGYGADLVVFTYAEVKVLSQGKPVVERLLIEDLITKTKYTLYGPMKAAEVVHIGAEKLVEEGRGVTTRGRWCHTHNEFEENLDEFHDP